METATEPGHEPATVLIVTEADGRERRYNANQSDDDEHGRLRLLRKGRKVGTYQHSAWLSVREDGALAWDQRHVIVTLRDALTAAYDAIDPLVADLDTARKILGDALDATDPNL